VFYDVSEHPLLSSKSKAIVAKDSKDGTEVFAEWTAYAAGLLGVTDKTFSGSELSSVNRALALQINYLLNVVDEMFIYKQISSAASKQNVTYRDPSLLFPAAVTIVSGLIGSWGNITSVRRQVR
jgi:hypothetical protein